MFKDGLWRHIINLIIKFVERAKIRACHLFKKCQDSGEQDIPNKKLTAYKKLYISASCTADYRFNTYRRLNSLDGAANIALISASIALIVVSFIVTMYSEKLGRGQVLINIGQNCLPIIMLALSILVSGAKYGTRADKIHECAQTLNHFKKILNFYINDEKFSPSPENFKMYAKQYADIISRYENHSKTDELIEQIRNISCPRALKIFLKLLASVLGHGLLYYFYLFIFMTSVGWMFLGIYLAIKEVLPC